MRNRLFCLVLLGFLVWMAALSPVAQAQELPALRPAVRVYDETGTSLTADQIDDLQSRMDSMAVTGPDAIVVVRNMMATPDETLDQVEAIQQAWAATTGNGDAKAVAILINRNPDDPHDARAGIYVGTDLDDGNVPESEQRAIVEDELIPPLREGDVYTSLTNGLVRLETSYLNGPPQSSLEKWAADATESWLLPVGLAIAAGLGGAITWLFRKRETSNTLPIPRSTQRPDNLHPGVGGALALGGPQVSAIPATILSLAERGGLMFEQESAGSRFSSPRLRIRLNPSAAPDDAIDRAVWMQLGEREEQGIVSSKNLQKIAGESGPTRKAIAEVLSSQGWVSDSLGGSRNGIVWVSIVAGVLAFASLIITGIGGNWISVISAVALGLVCIGGMVAYFSFSPLTRSGQAAAEPWNAYRSGLKSALRQRSTPLDLNAVLTDAVALNLGSDATKRVEAAQEAGVVLNAFAGSNLAVAFPIWVAFNSTVTSASGSGSSSVSGGGAGGGGGAAGST